MFNLGKRLVSQGITWEQLAFQFPIVHLGVYLAIAFERRAEERGRVEDAQEMLGRVLEEIRLDEADILAIIEGREEVSTALDSLRFLISSAPNRHGEGIHSLLYGPLFAYPTIFPRRAAYTGMVSGGYLTAVADQDLALRLADLHEHWHARIVWNGEITDRLINENNLVFNTNWDLDRRLFLRPDLEGTAPARNAMRTIQEHYCDWYIGTLLPEFSYAVTNLRTGLERYLGTQLVSWTKAVSSLQRASTFTFEEAPSTPRNPAPEGRPVPSQVLCQHRHHE